jgi:hypothetical protein
MQKVHKPLLKIGSFGTHVICAPSGKFIFVGSIPVELNNTRHETENAAIDAFVTMFKSWPKEDIEKYSPGLRPDVAAKVEA